MSVAFLKSSFFWKETCIPIVSRRAGLDIQLTKQKLRKMTSSNDLRQGSVLTDKLFEMINQEVKVLGRKYLVLPSFGICCREPMGLKVTSFRACMRSFCSVCPITDVLYGACFQTNITKGGAEKFGNRYEFDRMIRFNFTCQLIVSHCSLYLLSVSSIAILFVYLIQLQHRNTIVGLNEY